VCVDGEIGHQKLQKSKGKATTVGEKKTSYSQHSIHRSVCLLKAHQRTKVSKEALGLVKSSHSHSKNCKN
jgi:hypothetical protein